MRPMRDYEVVIPDLRALGRKTNLGTLNPLNAELSPICHLLALLGARRILHVSKIGVNGEFKSATLGIK